MSQPEPREVDLRQFASKVQAFGFDFVLEEFDRSWHAPEGISVQTPYTEYLRSKGRLEASLAAADSVQALMTEIGHPPNCRTWTYRKANSWTLPCTLWLIRPSCLIPAHLGDRLVFSKFLRQQNKGKQGVKQMSKPTLVDTDAQGCTAPTETTIKANLQAQEDLPVDDSQDFKDAQRGWIASEPDLEVINADGHRVWDLAAYQFIEGEAPSSVHPSLWRQAKLNNINGLFEVTPGIYQVRGYDLANLTIIEGRNGWIVVDTLTCEHTAAAAFALAKAHLKPKPVVAIIFTHSHIDHFGGVTAIVSAAEAADKKVRIVAPQGFVEESVSESVIAGIAMRRRAQYMYGNWLARSERGHVDTGLGKEPAIGKIGILTPTDLITRTPQEMEIDGVRFIFQNAPESEAPAELTFYLPDLKAYCGAEIVSRNLGDWGRP